MENVPGLMAKSSRVLLEEEMELLKDYVIVGPLMVDAHNFGAATHRRRVIVIGYRDLQQLSRTRKSAHCERRACRRSRTR